MDFIVQCVYAIYAIWSGVLEPGCLERWSRWTFDMGLKPMTDAEHRGNEGPIEERYIAPEEKQDRNREKSNFQNNNRPC